MAENAKIRKAQLMYHLSKDCGIPEYKKVLHSHITHLLTGEFLLPLPEAPGRTYSAKEIGDKLGMTAHRVGLLTNKHGLKTDEYGTWCYDKAKTSDKQVTTFRYFPCIVDRLRQIV